MCTLHAVFVLWVCLRETWTVVKDDPQYKVMKYLVFGTILSSLLSELQIIIPKTDRNGRPRATCTPSRIHSGNRVCSIWQPCARDSGNKIAVSAHGMREVQTLAFAVHDGRDVLLRNISPEIDPTLEGARRRSTASARSEAEPRTRTTARPLVSAARRSRPSRSPPPPERRPLPSVDVRMVGKARQAGDRPRRGRARRIRADGTISGPAVGHLD